MKKLLLFAALAVACVAQDKPAPTPATTLGSDPTLTKVIAQRNDLANSILNANVEVQLLRERIVVLEAENAQLKKDNEALKPKPPAPETPKVEAKK